MNVGWKRQLGARLLADGVPHTDGELSAYAAFVRDWLIEDHETTFRRCCEDEDCYRSVHDWLIDPAAPGRMPNTELTGVAADEVKHG